MTNEEYKEKQQMIAQLERKGRYVTTSWFSDSALHHKHDIVSVISNSQDCPVDLTITTSKGMELNLVSSYTANVQVEWNIEVKTNTKTTEEIEKYPSFILKKSKYNEMQGLLQDKGNAALLYVCILNDSTLYLYDISDIEKVPYEEKELPLKPIQYDMTNDRREMTPCYILPMNAAMRVIDVSEYIDQYNTLTNADNLQAKEEK